MSLIASSFDLTGSYLASCIVALDSHRLRIQSVDPSSSNALSNSFTLDKNLKVISLSWGIFASASDVKLESQYVAICLNNGNIVIYSPVQNEIISTLESQSGSAALSFHHSKLTGTAFSVDVNGTISEWDLTNYKLLRNFKISHLSSNNNEQLNQVVTVMLDNKIHLLVASYGISIIDLADLNSVIHTFPGHISPIHTILPISDDLFLTAAHNDRFINIYSISKKNIEKVLVAQSNVLNLSFGEYESKRTLIAVTEENIEIFNDPLLISQDLNGSASSKFSKKKKIKSKSKNSDATLSISRPLHNPTNEVLKIILTFTKQNKFIIMWLENSSIPFFDTIIWYEEDAYKLNDKIQVTKEKPIIKLTDHSLHGHDFASAKHYNEGNAIVQTGDNFKDLEDDNEEEEEESLAEKVSKLNVPAVQLPKEKKKKASTGTLTTVLTQAIKSNDHSLLETVLNNRDEDVIKNTIKKLSTNYVIPLLNRISERIARNSNKQSTLNVWIKWLFIIHGGFLNNYSNLTKNLGILHSTLHRRSLTLTRLLELNGKIDMVLENMELKKLILKSSNNNEYGIEDEDDDSGVEYIEELEDNGLDLMEESEIDDEQMDDYIEDDDDESDPEPIANGEEDEEEEEEDNYSDDEVDVKKTNGDMDIDSE